MFDSHCHLQSTRFSDDDIQTLLTETISNGVTKVACNGCSTGDWDRVAWLATTYPNFVVPQFGVHPWNVNEEMDISSCLIKLSNFLDQFPQAGVGETGLDNSQRLKQAIPIDRQISFFEQQLKLAITRRRAISIHCVRAHGRLYKILKTASSNLGGMNPTTTSIESEQNTPAAFRASSASVSSMATTTTSLQVTEEECLPLPIPIVLHSYSGPKEMIKAFAKLGCYFSFSCGVITSEKGASIIPTIPTDRLLVESDSPDQPPKFISYDEESRNHPKSIFLVCQFMAKILKLDTGVLSKVTAANAMRVFCPQ